MRQIVSIILEEQDRRELEKGKVVSISMANGERFQISFGEESKKSRESVTKEAFDLIRKNPEGYGTRELKDIMGVPIASISSALGRGVKRGILTRKPTGKILNTGKKVYRYFYVQKREETKK